MLMLMLMLMTEAVVRLVIEGAVSSPGALNASTGWIWRSFMVAEPAPPVKGKY
jgi:hypothetical protein